MTGVTIVWGPPGAGKSTLVAAQKGDNDLVVDLDLIAAALCGRQLHDKPEWVLPFALSARRAVLDRAKKPSGARRVWVVIGAPTRRERRQLQLAFPAARWERVDATEEECRARVASRPVDMTAAVADWFGSYEP